MSISINSPSETFTLESLKQFTETDMNRVNEVIEQHLSSEVVLINQLSQHIIHSGGKRLRPMLVMLAAKACGYEGNKDALLAAIIEFIHTATLLHDDVVDESEMRRGEQTASTIWGNEAAVLVGDYLYSRAFQLMVLAESMQIMNLLADTTNTIAQGEVLQLLNINDPDTSEEKYHQVIYSKTACLFEAACKTGSIISNSSDNCSEALGEYGKHLGIAFQLVDDALDYEADSEKLGKNVGDDLAEGKPTLPLIHAMQQGTEEQRDLIRGAIENGGLEKIKEITLIIKQTGSLQYTHQQAIKHAEKAKKTISSLPDSQPKQALLFLADYAVERSY
ncbi:MAG: octaprenyl diphosphate synthase [Gammaproteobacteria bacterium]|nr:octaprenyl diphosphate synthase [Gammaproteobacteria bacterium]